MPSKPDETSTTANLLAGYVTLEQLATENGGCSRSWRNFLDRTNVAFVKLIGARRYPLDAVRSAVEKSLTPRAPRRPGRPRKA